MLLTLLLIPLLYIYIYIYTCIFVCAGVGQVVLQVAAEGMCIASYGIEKQDNPALYAKVCCDVIVAIAIISLEGL